MVTTTPPGEPNGRGRDTPRSGSALRVVEGFRLVFGLLRLLLKFSRKRPATDSSAKAASDEAVPVVSRKRYLTGLWSAFFVTWGLYLALGLFCVVFSRLYPLPDDISFATPSAPKTDREMMSDLVWSFLILIVLPLFLFVGAAVSGVVTAFFWNNDLSFEREERAKKNAVLLVLAPTFIIPIYFCFVALPRGEWLLLLDVVFLYAVFAGLPLQFYCAFYCFGLDNSRGFWLERRAKNAQN